MKKVLFLATAFLVMGLTCWYLWYYNETVYPGLIGNLSVAVWMFPIAMISNLISNMRRQNQSLPTTGFKIFVYCVMAFLLGCNIYHLIKTHGYGYFGLVGIVAMVVVIIIMHLATAKIQEQFPENDYRCIGTQSLFDTYPPLGAYAFVDAKLDVDWVFVNKLTGEITVGF